MRHPLVQVACAIVSSHDGLADCFGRRDARLENLLDLLYEGEGHEPRDDSRGR